MLYLLVSELTPTKDKHNSECLHTDTKYLAVFLVLRKKERWYSYNAVEVAAL
jgi:hypothetical protein